MEFFCFFVWVFLWGFLFGLFVFKKVIHERGANLGCPLSVAFFERGKLLLENSADVSFKHLLVQGFSTAYVG